MFLGDAAGCATWAAAHSHVIGRRSWVTRMDWHAADQTRRFPRDAGRGRRSRRVASVRATARATLTR